MPGDSYYHPLGRPDHRVAEHLWGGKPRNPYTTALEMARAQHLRYYPEAQRKWQEQEEAFRAFRKKRPQDKEELNRLQKTIERTIGNFLPFLQQYVQNTEELNRLQKTIERTIGNFLPFLQQYVQNTEEILTQLPGVLEHLARDPAKEIKLGLDSKQKEKLGIDDATIFWMEHYERWAKITDLSIPAKIQHFKGCLENRQEKIISENPDFFGKKQDLLHKYIKYLTSLQETLQTQYEELGKTVKKYKDERRRLMELPNLPEMQNKLAEIDQGYPAFLEGQSLSPATKQFLLEQALQRYRPKRVFLLILSKATKLAELASETIFDDIIAEMQEQQKRAAEYLDSEDCDASDFFLKSQRHKTNYYSKHPNLVLLRQKQGKECGNIATWMAAADKDESYLDPEEFAEGKKIYKLLDEFDRLSLPELALPEGCTDAIEYPIILKRLKHPIEYEYCYNEDLLFNKWELQIMHPPCLLEEYTSSTGRVSRKITAEQLKSAIMQKREEDTIIIPVTRKREDIGMVFDGHNILVDATVVYRDSQTGEGEEEYVVHQYSQIGQGEEEYVVYRNLKTGKEEAVSWKDFQREEVYIAYRDGQPGKGEAIRLKDILENWSGEAIIPVGALPHPIVEPEVD